MIANLFFPTFLVSQDYLEKEVYILANAFGMIVSNDLDRKIVRIEAIEKDHSVQVKNKQKNCY